MKQLKKYHDFYISQYVIIDDEVYMLIQMEDGCPLLVTKNYDGDVGHIRTFDESKHELIDYETLVNEYPEYLV